MKKFFENWDWEDTAFSAVLVIALLIASILWNLTTADHKVRFYYLSGTYSDTTLRIRGDIDWGEDETILLDRTVTFEQGLKMVEELNTNLLYDGD